MFTRYLGDTLVPLREAPAQEKRCSNGLCPNSFSTPPPPQVNERFVGAIFSENQSIF